MFRDNQEAFDVALAHLRSQGKRAVVLINKGSPHAKAMCVYRGPGNDKCAVGALFPDELYNPEYEGKGAMSLVNYPGMARWFRNVNPHVLQDIQGAHDHALDANFMYSMEQNMMFVAQKWNLKYRGPAEDFRRDPPESFQEYLRNSSIGVNSYEFMSKYHKPSPFQYIPDEMTYYEPGPFDKPLPMPTVKDICPTEKLKANPKQFYF